MTKPILHVTGLLVILTAAIHAAPNRNQTRPGWIGLGYTYHQAVNPSQPGWLHVQRLAPRGPAESAGLKAQDVITAINGRPLRFKSDPDVLAFFAGILPKQELSFTVIRQQKRLTIKVKAIEMPAEYLGLWQKNQELAKRRAQEASQ